MTNTGPSNGAKVRETSVPPHEATPDAHAAAFMDNGSTRGLRWRLVSDGLSLSR